MPSLYNERIIDQGDFSVIDAIDLDPVGQGIGPDVGWNNNRIRAQGRLHRTVKGRGGFLDLLLFIRYILGNLRGIRNVLFHYVGLHRILRYQVEVSFGDKACGHIGHVLYVFFINTLHIFNVNSLNICYVLLDEGR